MKIISVSERVIHDVVVEEYGVTETLRRNSAGCWEILMGESWEPLYRDEEKEAGFQLFVKGEADEVH